MDSEEIAEKKEDFFNCLRDSVIDVVDYDRRDDEELTDEDIEELIKEKHITLEEVMTVLQETWKEHFK